MDKDFSFLKQRMDHFINRCFMAIAAASYRTGVKLVDQRTGITHDYSHRLHVVFSEVLLPEGANTVFLDREILWNFIETAEKGVDAQLCKDVVLALPKELNRVQQIELVRHFANTHFVTNELPAE